MKALVCSNVGLMTCLVLFLSGCGQAKLPENVKETSLAVDGQGVVSYYFVDDFDKEYYDLSELSSMAMDEVAEFNAQNPGTEKKNPVVLKTVEMVPGTSDKVRLSYEFDSVVTFEKFLDCKLFYGTVGEAILKGNHLTDGVKEVKSGAFLSEEELIKNSGQKVLITDTQAIVYAPGRVAGISKGNYREDGTVDTTQTEGNVIILVK